MCASPIWYIWFKNIYYIIMASEIPDYMLEEMTDLTELYNAVDIFDTVMESLEDMLDNVIGLYEEIENLTIYKCCLESGHVDSSVLENTTLESEIERVKTEISAKEEIFNIILNNSKEIASNLYK